MFSIFVNQYGTLTAHTLMAAGSGGRDHRRSASSQPLTTEETTTAKTKRRRFTTLAPTTPQSTLTSLTPSSDHQSQLPINLIAEILARLPVKPLLQFKCVCKSWNALISDPKFAKKQLLRASASDPTRVSPRHHLIVTFRGQRLRLLRDYSLTSVFKSSIATPSERIFPPRELCSFNFLYGSCHGMLCLASDSSRPFLWNPSTGKFKYLPFSEIHAKNGCKYGFGYDNFSDTYKVVSVSILLPGIVNFGFDRPLPDFDIDVWVHTLGTDSWRRIEKFPVGIPFESGRFVSGALSWLVKDKPFLCGFIVSLDLGTETYQQLLLPPYHGADVNVNLNLAVLKGCLCILAHCYRYSDVWVMKDYGKNESWTNLFSIPYLGSSPEWHPYYSRLFCVSDGDGEMLLKSKDDLVVYNPKSGTFRTPGILISTDGSAWIQKFISGLDAEVYAESLISPC